MAYYTLQRYLYDCFRLEMLRRELDELMTNYASCVWSHGRISHVVAEITTLQADTARYENLPQNRPQDDE